MGRNSSTSTSLAPGFRFHPTDEELVWYYLRRKVCGKPFRVDAISEIDIYKFEPFDLPGLSKLKTRDLEWYFFSALDRKYGHGSKTNRATNEGYWKTTGKDRPITHRSQVVGMKKTLVYHRGRAPRGQRTNWVMHEYKLIDKVLEKAGYFPDGYVLCRVFQKSGTGPKNGEKYGAPLMEEEWEDDNLEAVVPSELSFEDPYVDDDAYIDQDDLDKVLDSQLPANVPFPASLKFEDLNNNLDNSWDIAGTEPNCIGSEDKYNLEALDDQKGYDSLTHVERGASAVQNQYMVEPNNMSNDVPAISLHELFSENSAPEDGLFLDAFDFLNAVQDYPEQIAGDKLDDEFDIEPYLNFDSTELVGSDSDHVISTKQNVDDATWQIPSVSQKLPEIGDDGIASTSKPSKTDTHYPCLQKAGSLLGNIPAPPAFASELPSKDVAARLSSAMQSPRSLTAGMVRIRDMPVIGSSASILQWSFDKTGKVNVLLSFDLPEVASPVGPESLTGLLSSKRSAAASRSWFCSMFFLVSVFALSFKIGLCIYAK